MRPTAVAPRATAMDVGKTVASSKGPLIANWLEIRSQAASLHPVVLPREGEKAP